MPSLDIIVPLVMGAALVWWVGRGLSWRHRLVAAAVTLAVIAMVVWADRSGYWPDAFRH